MIRVATAFVAHSLERSVRRLVVASVAAVIAFGVGIISGCTNDPPVRSAADEACTKALAKLDEFDEQAGDAIIDSGVCDEVSDVLKCDEYAAHRLRMDGLFAALESCKAGSQ